MLRAVLTISALVMEYPVSFGRLHSTIEEMSHRSECAFSCRFYNLSLTWYGSCESVQLRVEPYVFTDSKEKDFLSLRSLLQQSRPSSAFRLGEKKAVWLAECECSAVGKLGMFPREVRECCNKTEERFS